MSTPIEKKQSFLQAYCMLLTTFHATTPSARQSAVCQAGC
jgi:hypothetical protein